MISFPSARSTPGVRSALHSGNARIRTTSRFMDGPSRGSPRPDVAPVGARAMERARWRQPVVASGEIEETHVLERSGKEISGRAADALRSPDDDARAGRGQRVVRCARADRNPLLTPLPAERERSAKRRSRFEGDDVARLRLVEGRLEVATRPHREGPAGGRPVARVEPD